MKSCGNWKILSSNCVELKIIWGTWKKLEMLIQMKIMFTVLKQVLKKASQSEVEGL